MTDNWIIQDIETHNPHSQFISSTYYVATNL